MKFSRFLKDQIYAILIFAVALAIVAALCVAAKISPTIIVAIVILIILAFIMTLLVAFFRKHAFYNNLLAHIDSLDQAYLVLETLSRPEFYDGEILVDALYQINKSMTENVNQIRNQSRDFQEYIELWVHEIKAPLAALTLLANRLKTTERQNFQLELSRLENYLEQVLYFARSESAAQDYLIKKTNLGKVVKNIGLKNMNSLLAANIDFVVENVDFNVYTDAKWLEFILGQILGNSIKYQRNIKHPYIKISAHQTDKDTVVLEVTDNGIGISAADLPQVFNKSFTGANGRKIGSSTGMGLYLAKRMCDNLGHQISLTSTINHGTTVKISFHNNDIFETMH